MGATSANSGSFKPLDISGRKFNMLTAIRSEKRPGGYHWLCKCDCGKEKWIRITSITSGSTRSCGCHSRARMAEANKTHGLTKHPIYSSWSAMKERCYRKKHSAYSAYAGRGISICDEWIDNFQAFYDWSVVSGWEPGLQIERKDNDKGYFPDNCCWATIKQQARNRRNTVYIEHNGSVHKFIELCESDGKKVSLMRKRMATGKTYAQSASY